MSLHLPMDKISRLAGAQRNEATAFRRDLHRHPEVGWTEFRTTAKLAAALTEMGLDVRLGREIHADEKRMGVPEPEVLGAAFARAKGENLSAEFIDPLEGGFTGLIGELDTGTPGPLIALRFDIDANDGEEAADEGHLPAREGFASEYPGAMHNCGHDGHATIGLMTAAILSELKEAFSGRVRFIFQPSEEGVRGALSMTEAGAVEGVDFYLAPHIGIGANRTGMLVAGSDAFQSLTGFDALFRGRSAHVGLAPEEGRNALFAAAEAIIGVEALALLSDRTRVNATMLNAGEGGGLVASRAELALVSRSDTTEGNRAIRARAEAVIQEAAARHGVEVSFRTRGDCPGGDSDPALAKIVAEVGRETGDFDEIVPHMVYGSGDDATYMMERVRAQGGKAAYLLLGTELPGGHHTPRFDFNEALLVAGSKLFAALVCRLASEGPARD